jgi:two-component system, NtrC family, response regulator HydG
MNARALVVDDDSTIRYTLRGILELSGVTIEEAADGISALECLESGAFDLVITDLRMPRMDGFELLRKIRERGSAAPRVIVVTAHGSERHAVEAIKSGAYDYFRKPFDIDELKAVVGRALESVRLSGEVERLSGELNLSRSLIFAARAMSELAVLVQRVAPRDVNVLLTGESGTGKERVAEAIVAASSRASKPFLRFNCAALTAELAEAELFGHTKGAFTGAVKTRAGLFREADGGTILLDEIGELAPLTQAKLLRVLQSGEIRPVGEDRPVRVDVRIIAATHRDLLQLATEGKFREDLYYRLKVVHLKIPSLRDRPEDIAPLARHFLGEYSKRFGVGPFQVTPALLDRLIAYDWPGNVRELENAIESAVVLARDELDLSLFPLPGSTSVPNAMAAPDGATASSLELNARVEAYERGVIVQALQANRNNRSQTARVLGVGRTTLLSKLKKYGLATGDEAADEAGGDAT